MRPGAARLGGIVGRRLLQSALLLLGVIVLSFALIQAAPGSFLDVMTSDQQVSDPAQIERLRVVYGMDAPAYVQLARYVWAVLHLDFGFSYRQNMPVLDAIMGRLPATLLLMLTSMTIAVALGVTAGIIAALKVNTVWDTLMSIFSVICFAMPSFWLGIMLIIAFSVKLQWLPVGDMTTVGGTTGTADAVLDVVRHLILPATSLGLFYAAVYARMMRSAMLEVMHLDFVRTAKAKGLTRAQVVVGHIVRNALLPVVTLLGLQLGTVLGGSVVVESVFAWPGLGSLLFDSVSSRNYPVVLGVMVFSALVVILVNIAVDIAYAQLDPRTRRR